MFKMTVYLYAVTLLVFSFLAMNSARKLAVTCDNVLTLYIDGVQVIDPTKYTSAEDWTKPTKISIPKSAKVFAIKCVDQGEVGGILGVFSKYVTTDGAWKCINEFQHGWTDEGFNDNQWPQAHVIGQYPCMGPWYGQVAMGKTHGAKWIWTQGWNGTDKEVYCRKELGESGGCPAVPSPNPEPSSVESCLKASDCWVKYDFLHDDKYYECTGGQYIRWLETYHKYVGVKVCEEGRYQIFLSNKANETSVTAMFENIGDSYGNGEDHCEFLGGTLNGTTGTPFNFIDWIYGYKREHWGDMLLHDQLDRCYSQDCGPWGANLVPWVQCPGVDIPGTNSVIEMGGRYPPAVDECYLVYSTNFVLTSRHDVTPSTHVFSCDSSKATDYEVHVVSVYESANGNTWEHIPGPLPLTIEAGINKQIHPIRLVLLNYEPVIWNIVTDVDIQEITMIAYHLANSTVNLQKDGSPYSTELPIVTRRDSLGYGARNPRDIKAIYGFITSFIGRYNPSSYILRVGV